MNWLPRPLAVAIAASLAVPLSAASEVLHITLPSLGAMDYMLPVDDGELRLASSLYLSGLSADGYSMAGTQYDAVGAHAVLVGYGGLQRLLEPEESVATQAVAVSADASVVAGWGDFSDGSMSALVWNAEGVTRLGRLDEGTDSWSAALGVSADGQVVVGYSTLDYSEHAVRWVNAGDGWSTAQDLQGGSFLSSVARAADKGGEVIVGSGNTLQLVLDESQEYLLRQGGYASEAFRWTAETGMVGLGVLAGHDSTGPGFEDVMPGSEATGVSQDGQVVVGSSWSAAGEMLAFRWTEQSGMSSLGMLAGGSYSMASAVNQDGSVVVGTADASEVVEVEGEQVSYAQPTAFRWTAEGGMQSVADWLKGAGMDLSAEWLKGVGMDLGTTRLYSAEAVSASGNAVLGQGYVQGRYQSYLARVDDAYLFIDDWPIYLDDPVVISPGDDEGPIYTHMGDGKDAAGLIGLTTYRHTLNAVSGVTASSSRFMQMTLFGAHHRPLADNGLSGSNCLWATADHGRSDDSSQSLQEVGGCTDIGATRLGLGIGNSRVRQDLPYHGDGDFRGQYLMAEADYRMGGGLLASLTGLYGRWDLDIDRAYLNGAAIDSSSGKTDASLWSLRGRLDWLDLLQLGNSSLSPFVAYSYSRSDVDGYSEVGGGFPAYFAPLQDTARELRAGASLKLPLASTLALRLTGEAVHRLDDGSTRSTATILGTSVSSQLTGNAVDRNWLRAGAELDWKLNERTLLSTSLNRATEGEDADLSGSLSLKYSF